MSSGRSDRFEYFKQPHVIFVGVLLVAAIVFACISGYQRLSKMQRVASLSTYDACREFIDDEHLCRFAEKEEENTGGGYVITSVATSETGTEITTVEVESEDRMRSITFEGPKETDAFIVIDSISYVKDYTDGSWAKYDDPSFVAGELSKTNYDFSSEKAASTVDFRENYHYEGQEPCGDLVCYKYKITSANTPTLIDYIWFDTQDYLLRRHLSTSGDASTNNQFEYREVHISEPSPVREVTEEEMSEFLGQE